MDCPFGEPCDKSKPAPAQHQKRNSQADHFLFFPENPSASIYPRTVLAISSGGIGGFHSFSSVSGRLNIRSQIARATIYDRAENILAKLSYFFPETERAKNARTGPKLDAPKPA